MARDGPHVNSRNNRIIRRLWGHLLGAAGWLLGDHALLYDEFLTAEGGTTPGAMPGAVHFDDEMASAPPTNVTKRADGNSWEVVAFASDGIGNQPVFDQMIEADVQGGGVDYAGASVALPSVPSGTIRMEVLFKRSGGSHASFQISGALCNADPAPANDYTESVRLVMYGLGSIDKSQAFYELEAGAVELWNDEDVSPFYGSSQWQMLQIEWNQDTGAIKIGNHLFDAAATTNWTEGTVPVEWTDADINYLYFQGYKGTAGDVIHVAQVWIGSGSDAWPEGVKVAQALGDVTTDIASPRTCEPGPGTLVVTRADEQFISGGAITKVDSAIYAGITGNAALTRDVGLGVFARPTAVGDPFWWVALNSDTAANNVPSGEYMRQTMAGCYYVGSGVSWEVLVTGRTFTLPYVAGIVLRSTGSFHIANGRLIWVSGVAGSAGDQYPQIVEYLGPHSTDFFWAGNIATEYNAIWGPDFSKVTASESAPVNGTEFDCEADAHIRETFTVENGQIVSLYFRYGGASDYVRMTVGSTMVPVLQWDDESAGLITEWTGAALTDAVEYQFDVTFDGPIVKVFIDNVLMTTKSITMNQDVAQARINHNLATNDIVLSTHPTPALGIATSHYICPQHLDTFTHENNFQAYIRNVTLPPVTNTLWDFRYVDLDNRVRLFLMPDGDYGVWEYIDGSPTFHINGSPGDISDGDDIMVDFNEAEMTVFIAGVQLDSTITLTDHVSGAASNLTQSVDATRDAIEFFPLYPPLPEALK